MSAMSQLAMELEEAVARGDLSFEEIARMFEVPRQWVVDAASDLFEGPQDVSYDHLERDWDEPYEPDVDRFDDWYEEQYEVEEF